MILEARKLSPVTKLNCESERDRGIKHCRSIQVQGQSAKTVTSLLTLLTLLFVAPVLLVGISIFNVSAGSVIGAENSPVFWWRLRLLRSAVILSKSENILFYHFFTTGYSYPMKGISRLSERMSHAGQG